jgi:hypothetical protein
MWAKFKKEPGNKTIIEATAPVTRFELIGASSRFYYLAVNSKYLKQFQAMASAENKEYWDTRNRDGDEKYKIIWSRYVTEDELIAEFVMERFHPICREC